MSDAAPREFELNNTVLTNLLLLTITGLLIMIAVENLELLALLDKCKDERCHKHHKHHKQHEDEREPEIREQP